MEQGKRLHYAWWILAIGFMLYFTIQALTMQVVGLFTIPISETFGVPRSVTLLHNVAWNAGGLIAAPIWGKLLKKYNFQRLMAFGIVMTAVGFLLRAVSVNIEMLIFAGFFRGVFFIGTTMLPISMLVTAWFEKQRGFAMSAVTIAAGLGGLIFNPLMQTIISEHGWQAADMVIAGLVAIMAPITWLMVRADPSEKGLLPYGHKKRDAEDEKDAKKDVPEVSAGGLTLKEARKTPHFYILLFASFSCTFVAGAMMQLAPFLTDIGYTPMFAAQMVGLLALLSMFGRPIMGLIYDRFKGTTAACIFFITAAMAFLSLTNAANIWFLRAGIVLWAFNSGISLIMPPLWTSALFGTKDFAAIVSLTVLINRFGSMTGGYLIGFLYDITGSNDLIWPVCSALMILSMCGIVFSLKRMTGRKEVFAAG